MTRDQPAPARRGRRQRLLSTLVALAALGPASLALLPSGGSQAVWHSEAEVALPGLSMDTLAVSAGANHDRVQQGSAATASATVTNGAVQTQALWAPISMAAATLGPEEGLADALAGQLVVDYRTGSCTTTDPVSWSTSGAGAISSGTGRSVLAPGSSAALCARATPATTDAELVTAYGGRAVTLTTTVDAHSAAPATWTSAPTSWDLTYQVPFPTPTLTCGPGSLGDPELSWGFPEGSGTPPVARWEVRNSAGAVVYDGTGTSTTVAGDDTYTVRAHPFTGSTYYVDGDGIATATAGVAGVLAPSCTTEPWAGRQSELPGDGATS